MLAKCLRTKEENGKKKRFYFIHGLFFKFEAFGAVYIKQIDITYVKLPTDQLVIYKALKR